MNTRIRLASPEDARELLEIYRPYVTDTAVSFEYEVPSEEEFCRRISDTLRRYPYLVAEEDGRPVGYACASAFKARRAYDWAVETTIYVKRECRGRGYGRRLYLALEECLKRQGILNLNACIAYTECEDERLTNDSMRFHAHMGYRLVGRFTQCGCKFGRWYDMIWMEKLIGEHAGDPGEVVPFLSVIPVDFSVVK